MLRPRLHQNLNRNHPNLKVGLGAFVLGFAAVVTPEEWHVYRSRTIKNEALL